MTTSLVYSHIHLYRFAMNVLYLGGYRRRFRDVIALIGDARSVCDLCFGDTIVARWCRDHDRQWTGVDINPHFCARARSEGFHVIEGDLFSLDVPLAEVYVMAGSLYHFHDRLPRFFDLVFRHTDRLILSEPVRNLSSLPGPLGSLARRGANPGNRPAPFRYDERSLLDALRQEETRLGLSSRVISKGRDLLVEIRRK
jgi:hypothetical protein